MLSGRPLLYLSLPGVVLLLGVFWYRRRNKNRKYGDVSDKELENLKLNSEDKENMNQKTNLLNSNEVVNPIPSDSVNIDGCRLANESPGVRFFGKSAPIQIVQSSRGSPVKQSESDQNNSKGNMIESNGLNTLHSVNEDLENLSSPVDLPDSVNNRIAFYSRNVNCKKDPPVVIRATRTPKISPENLFFEEKYTKECEQNNNLEPIGNIKECTTKESDFPTQDQVSQNEAKDSNAKENGDTIEPEVIEKCNAASPSLSLCSIQTGDSGTGSSLPRSEVNRAKTTYEFFFPNSLIGQLYGKNRSYINQIKSKTAAHVTIRKTRYSNKLRICVIEGTESEVNAALLMIRQRLPATRFPNFTMQRIHFALPQSIVPLSKESLLSLQLNLIEGINNDVIVTAVISGAHIFVQHPLHPTHPSLPVLQKCLYDSYSASEAPLLPRIEITAVCVLPVNHIWYRVQIVDEDPEDEQRCLVKFLDFGGYMNVHFKELRQIRADFMGVPFQATECMLSNIEPIGSSWSPEAADILCRLTKGIVLQAQIAGYNSHNIPEIYLFACLGPNNVIFINRELEARNLARWVELRD